MPHNLTKVRTDQPRINKWELLWFGRRAELATAVDLVPFSALRITWMKKSVYYMRILAVCVVVYWPIFAIRDFLSRRWSKAVMRSEIGNFVGICTGSKGKLIQNRREKGNLIMGWSRDYQDFSQLYWGAFHSTRKSGLNFRQLSIERNSFFQNF